MRVSVLTLPFDLARQRFDPAPLDELARTREITSVREHLCRTGKQPFLVLVVEHVPRETPPPVDSPTPPRAETPPRTADVRASLPPSAQKLFDRLCTWRREQSRHEAVPAYVILTNRELREVALEVPRSRATLQKIPGIGPRKVARYGKALLALLGEQEQPSSTGGAGDSLGAER